VGNEHQNQEGFNVVKNQEEGNRRVKLWEEKHFDYPDRERKRLNDTSNRGTEP